jgi:hypothetical protein
VAVSASDAALPVAMALTDASGNYSLGLSGSNPWTLAAIGNKLWPQDQLSSQINKYTTTISPVTGNDLTVYAANAWIIGTVRNAQGQPMARVKIIGWNGDSSLRTGGLTDTDGTYRLPAKGQIIWTVDALTEDAGQGRCAPQPVSLMDGQTATLDFTAPLPTVLAPTTISVPAIDADGSYAVSWGASPTAGVAYVLQEATSNTFTTGLRLAYRGTALTANITGRSAGTTYYYRVRVVKGGLKDSGYRAASGGCRVGP